MVGEQTLVIHENIRVQRQSQKYLNLSHNKESYGTKFFRLDYHNLLSYIFYEMHFAQSLINALY